MSFSNEVLEQDARENAQRLNAKNRTAWEEILNDENFDQTEGESFYQRVLTFCEGEITFAKYVMLTATCPAGFDFSNPEWRRGTKDALIAKIVEKKRRQLSDSRGVLDPRDAVELRNFEASLLNLSKAQLRAKQNELEFKEEIRTASQARDFLAKNRLLAGQQNYFTKDGAGPFPRLPLHVVPPGFVTAIPLDAKYIRGLDVAEIQKLTRRYSDEQVTKRLSDTLDSLHQQ